MNLRWLEPWTAPLLLVAILAVGSTVVWIVPGRVASALKTELEESAKKTAAAAASAQSAQETSAQETGALTAAVKALAIRLPPPALGAPGDVPCDRVLPLMRTSDLDKAMQKVVQEHINPQILTTEQVEKEVRLSLKRIQTSRDAPPSPRPNPKP